MGRKFIIESVSIDTGEHKFETYEVTEEEEEFYANQRALLAKLPEASDPMLVILKGHLIIEQQLIRLIEQLTPDPKPILDLARLSFSIRLSIVESLMPPKSDKPVSIWNLVRALNNLRNELAHNLDADKFNEKANIFLNIYRDFFGPIVERELKNNNINEKLRNAIAGTMEGMAGMLAVTYDNKRKGHEI